jgi:hypothetical protein
MPPLIINGLPHQKSKNTLQRTLSHDDIQPPLGQKQRVIIRKEVRRNLYYPEPSGSGWTAPQNTRFYSLARFAILDGLKSLGLKSGDQVLIPSLMCRDVLAPFHSLGLEIKFYDVDQQLEPISLIKDPKIKAIMAVNYFGFPAAIEKFKKYCVENNCFLIEDNAHGFLSRDPQGNFLGDRGDVGIFSFRKTLSIPDGAGLVTSRPLSEQISFNPRTPASYHVKRTLKKATPVLGRGLGRHLQRLSRNFRTLEINDDLAVEETMPSNPHPTIQLPVAPKKLNVESEISRRQKLFKLIAPVVKVAGGRLTFETCDENVSPFCLPFYANDAEFSKVQEALGRLDLEAFTWPDLPIRLRTVVPNYYHQLRCVIFLW